MSWQLEAAKWLGLFTLAKILPPIYNRVSRRVVRDQARFVDWQTLNEYQTVLWLRRKPERFYNYAFESIAGALKMVAWAGSFAAVGVLLYHLPFSEKGKAEIAQWSATIVVVIFSFMMTHCRIMELRARRLNGFDQFRATLSPEIVKQAEDDPRLK